MNIKNIIFSALMFSVILPQSFVIAGVPTNMLEGSDKVVAASVVGVAGAATGGVLLAQKGAVAGAYYGAALGAAAGPLGALVGGAAGVVVGGAAGAVTGYVGLVVVKALRDELKKSH